MQHVFVYGSLLFSEIVSGLTEKSFETKKAVLKDYKRCAIDGCDYPAIIPEKGREVNGVLLMNVDKQSMDILSFYEGEEYEKTEIELSLNSHTIAAVAFVWKRETDVLLLEDWDKETFKNESKQFYIREVVPATVKEFYDL